MAVCGAASDAAIVLVFPASAYRHYTGTTTVLNPTVVAPLRENHAPCLFFSGVSNPDQEEPEPSRTPSDVTESGSHERRSHTGLPDPPPRISPPRRPVRDREPASLPSIEENIVYQESVEEGCKWRLTTGGAYLGTKMKVDVWNKLQVATRRGNNYMEKKQEIMKTLAEQSSMRRGGSCHDGGGGSGEDSSADGDRVRHTASSRGRMRGGFGDRGGVKGRALIKDVAKAVGKGVDKIRRPDLTRKDSAEGGIESGNDTEKARGAGNLNPSRRRTRSPSPPARLRRVHSSPPDPCDARPINQCRASWGGHKVSRGARIDKDTGGRSSSLELESGQPSPTLRAAGGAQGAQGQRPTLSEGGGAFRRPREEVQRPPASSAGRNNEIRSLGNRSGSSSASENRERSAAAVGAGVSPNSDARQWRDQEREESVQVKRARRYGLGQPRHGQVGPGTSERATARQGAAVGSTAPSAGKKPQDSQSNRPIAKVARRPSVPGTTAVADRRRPTNLSGSTSHQQPKWTPAQDELDQERTAPQPKWTPAQDEEQAGSPQARNPGTVSRFGQPRPSRDKGAASAKSRPQKWTPAQAQSGRERTGAPTSSLPATAPRATLLSR